MNMKIRSVAAGLFILNISMVVFSLTKFAMCTTRPLDLEIRNLSAHASVLQQDQTVTIHNLMSISNLLNGALLTAPIVATAPGTKVSLPITLIPSTFFPAGIQVDLSLPAGIILNSITIGPAALAAGKSISTSGNRLIIFGLNQNPISAGVVAIANFTLPPTKTFYPISFINPVFVDGNGKAVIASTTSGTVVVQ